MGGGVSGMVIEMGDFLCVFTAVVGVCVCACACMRASVCVCV